MSPGLQIKPEPYDVDDQSPETIQMNSDMIAPKNICPPTNISPPIDICPPSDISPPTESNLVEMNTTKTDLTEISSVVVKPAEVSPPSDSCQDKVVGETKDHVGSHVEATTTNVTTSITSSVTSSVTSTTTNKQVFINCHTFVYQNVCNGSSVRKAFVSDTGELGSNPVCSCLNKTYTYCILLTMTFPVIIWVECYITKHIHYL